MLSSATIIVSPDWGIDFIDIAGCVDAFKGSTYWESMPMCPALCPPPRE